MLFDAVAARFAALSASADAVAYGSAIEKGSEADSETMRKKESQTEMTCSEDNFSG